jgi:hypothetical protein
MVMGLADEIRCASEVSGRRTRIDEILSSLSEDDAADLVAALLDASVRAPAIQRALRNRGIGVSITAIRSYREAHRVVE